MSKRIEYSRHALQQMQDRGITEVQARWLLTHGKPCQATSRPGRETRRAMCGLVGSKEAKAVYLENADRIFVVTVMWVYERE